MLSLNEIFESGDNKSVRHSCNVKSGNDISITVQNSRNKITGLIPAASIAALSLAGCAQILGIDEFSDGGSTGTGGTGGACAEEELYCDGLDDNCNDEIDEGFGVGEACSSGIGECEVSGEMVCSEDGTGTICDAVPNESGLEVCNGLDDDCNNETDENEFEVEGKYFSCSEHAVSIDASSPGEAHKFFLYNEIDNKMTEGSMSSTGSCENYSVQAIVEPFYKYRGWSSGDRVTFKTYFLNENAVINVNWATVGGFDGPPSDCVTGVQMENALINADNNNLWTIITPFSEPCSTGEQPHCVSYTIDLSTEDLNGETPLIDISFFP